MILENDCCHRVQPATEPVIHSIFSNFQPFHRYDPCTDTWQNIRQLPSPRSYSTAGVVDNKIYIIGGLLERHIPWSDVYDTEKNEYSEVRTELYLLFRENLKVVL